ncbi:hypothetical protein [Winogradskyella algicola]|jgi:hypothetical protein|uniref:hypothetical protein n=1 Tax=Winogradskyella algicola TaxID=2575815 RepID=UPI0011081E74|nr:hypothetical protein [Winogradskyella algicola]
MGHGPNLKKAIKDNNNAIQAVNEAIAKAEKSLQNTEDKAIAYINKHTKGIIDNGIIASNPNTYSKFSETYSLDILDGIIDGAIKFAEDYLDPGKTETKAAQMAGDVGQVVKSTLALFATSSSSNEKLQVVFNQFRSGNNNYAIYYACNSMSVKADNAWGSKEIMVVTNMYVFAQVKPNPDITHQQVIQADLDAIAQANISYDNAIVAAKSQKELDALTFEQKKINLLKTKLENDLKNTELLMHHKGMKRS